MGLENIALKVKYLTDRRRGCHYSHLVVVERSERCRHGCCMMSWTGYIFLQL